jgi:hypothetical protein
LVQNTLVFGSKATEHLNLTGSVDSLAPVADAAGVIGSTSAAAAGVAVAVVPVLEDPQLEALVDHMDYGLQVRTGPEQVDAQRLQTRAALYRWVDC